MRVASAFDKAVQYDRHAPVQRQVADSLAEHIRTLPLPPAPRILEIGCGTGFLGAALIGYLPGAEWWMTDVSPAMIARAKERFAGREDIRFKVMDGSAPDLPGGFDMICSSLAMQWFADLAAGVSGLRSLLSPEGRIAFTTLGAGSFAEWRAAHGDLAAGTPDYPSAAHLSAMGLDVSVRAFTHVHDDARDFLRAVKAIGAGTPRADHRPLSPAKLRQVLARFEAEGAIARYMVATCTAGPGMPA